MKKLMWLMTVMVVLAGFSAGAEAKKVIQFGYDDPDSNTFVAQIDLMKNQPLDGSVFTTRPVTGTNNEFTWQAWGTTVFSRPEMQHAVDELASVNFGNFNETFMRMCVTPANVDWFDDFSTIIANCGTAAWIVAQGGAKGIMFDLENYEGQLWLYSAQKYKTTKTFAQYQAQVRLRGQEVMQAMQAEDPNIIIFLPVAYSYVWSPSQINGNLALLPTVEYGLMPSFLDGMLDVAGAGVAFVDGYEASYGFKTLSQFQNAKTVMQTGCLPIVADDSKYAAKFSFGFGLWMDYQANSGNWHENPSQFSLNHFTPDEFQTALEYALSVSDEYVWIYSETLFWWDYHGTRNIPHAYKAAVLFGKSDEFMDFVTVGDVGNNADTRPVSYLSTNYYFGQVDHSYSIGKYEVTNDQYCTFLNAVAASDQHGLYDDVMMGDSTYPWRGGIMRSGSSGSYTYSTMPSRAHLPVNWVTWRSAARMANWMHNGMQNDPNTTEYGAYDASTFTGSDWNKTDQAVHSPDAKYWIPTVNEWYKAAFYKGGGTNAGYWTFATKSDTIPAGGSFDSTFNQVNWGADNYDFGEGYDHGDTVSAGCYTSSPGPYGTFDQSGNNYEYCEDWAFGTYYGNYRLMYGGAWKYNDSEQLRFDTINHIDPAVGSNYERGFRLAATAVGPCNAPITGDLNNDCKVDFLDMRKLAVNWLDSETALFDVQFTDDTIGSQPSVAPAIEGGVSTNPTFWRDQTDKNVSTVVANTYTDSVTGQVFGTGNVAVLTDNDATGYIVALHQGVAADEVSSGLHTISMDIMIDSRADGTGNFFVSATNQARGLATAEMFIEFDTGAIRDSGNGGSFGVASKGYSHHVDWVLDLDLARTEYYLDGVFKGYGALIETDFFGNASLFSSAAAVGTMAVDNYKVWFGRHVMSAGMAADLNDDGKVNFEDFVILAGDWMECNLVPVEACDN